MIALTFVAWNYWNGVEAIKTYVTFFFYQMVTNTQMALLFIVGKTTLDNNTAFLGDSDDDDVLAKN